MQTKLNTIATNVAALDLGSARRILCPHIVAKKPARPTHLASIHPTFHFHTPFGMKRTAKLSNSSGKRHTWPVIAAVPLAVGPVHQPYCSYSSCFAHENKRHHLEAASKMHEFKVLGSHTCVLVLSQTVLALKSIHSHPKLSLLTKSVRGGQSLNPALISLYKRICIKAANRLHIFKNNIFTYLVCMCH